MKNTLKLTLGAIAFAAASAVSAQTTLLNVSYDVAREFYKDINVAFAASYKKSSAAKTSRSTSRTLAPAHRPAPWPTAWTPTW